MQTSQLDEEPRNALTDVALRVSAHYLALDDMARATRWATVAWQLANHDPRQPMGRPW